MATYHTDYLLGNDTTGNGSAALPWKTITRAYTSAVSDDIIKVAGSTISDVPGLILTPTNNTGTFTSNISPTGLISIGDVISLTHPQFGADKYFFNVFNIVGNTITLNTGINDGFGITYAVRKFNQIHYATTTTNTVFENPTSTGKNRIRVLGGWNSDFTLQNGWTVARFQGATQTATSGTFQSNPGGVDVYREKFCFVNLATGFGGSVNNEYWGDLIGSFVSSMFGAIPRNETGYKPKWYMNRSNCQGGTTTLINTDGSFGLQISEFYTNLFNISSSSWGNCGFDIENVYVMSNGDSWNTSNIGFIPTTAAAKIGNITIYQTNENVKMYAGNSSVLWNGTLTFNGPLSNPVVYVGNRQDGNVMWNNPTQNVSNFRYWSFPNNPIWSYDTYRIAIKDIEGDKTLSSNGLLTVDTTDYLTGTNSLKIQKPGRNSQGNKVRLSQFMVNDSSTSLTITLTAKQTSSSALVFSINGFGLVRDLSLANRTVGTTWGTYSWTITGTDLNTLKSSKCFLIWNSVFDATRADAYLWVDNVVITQS